jgi:hypothetical protein
MMMLDGTTSSFLVILDVKIETTWYIGRYDFISMSLAIMSSPFLKIDVKRERESAHTL